MNVGSKELVEGLFFVASVGLGMDSLVLQASLRFDALVCVVKLP